MGGVDAHVEVFHIPPGAAGIQLVELGPAAVYALDLLLQLPVGQVLFSGAFLPATLQLALHIGVNQDAEGLAVPQDLVGTAAHNDAAGLGRHLLDDLHLLLVNGHRLLKGLVGGRVEAVANVDGIGKGGAMLHNGLDILLRQGGAPGDFLNDLLVVVGKAQLFRQAAQLPAPLPNSRLMVIIRFITIGSFLL